MRGLIVEGLSGLEGRSPGFLSVGPLGPHPGAPTTNLVIKPARNPVTAGSLRSRRSRGYAESQERCHPGVIPEGPRTLFEIPGPPPPHDHPTHGPSSYFHEPQKSISLASENRDRPSGRPPISTYPPDTFPGLSSHFVSLITTRLIIRLWRRRFFRRWRRWWRRRRLVRMGDIAVGRKRPLTASTRSCKRPLGADPYQLIAAVGPI